MEGRGAPDHDAPLELADHAQVQINENGGHDQRCDAMLGGNLIVRIARSSHARATSRYRRLLPRSRDSDPEVQNHAAVLDERLPLGHDLVLQGPAPGFVQLRGG